MHRRKKRRTDSEYSSLLETPLPANPSNCRGEEKLQQVFELLLLPRSSRLVLAFTAVLGLFDSSSDRVPDTAQVSQDEKEDLVCPTPLF